MTRSSKLARSVLDGFRSIVDSIYLLRVAYAGWGGQFTGGGAKLLSKGSPLLPLVFQWRIAPVKPGTSSEFQEPLLAYRPFSAWVRDTSMRETCPYQPMKPMTTFSRSQGLRLPPNFSLQDPASFSSSITPTRTCTKKGLLTDAQGRLPRLSAKKPLAGSPVGRPLQAHPLESARAIPASPAHTQCKYARTCSRSRNLNPQTPNPNHEGPASRPRWSISY